MNLSEYISPQRRSIIVWSLCRIGIVILLALVISKPRVQTVRMLFLSPSTFLTSGTSPNSQTSPPVVSLACRRGSSIDEINLPPDAVHRTSFYDHEAPLITMLVFSAPTKMCHCTTAHLAVASIL